MFKKLWQKILVALAGIGLITYTAIKIAQPPQVSITPSGIIQYGFNANIEFIPYSFDNLKLDSAINSLHPQVLRIPGGERMNLYNWRTDTPSVADLKILYEQTHANLIIGLNMVTSTLSEQLQFLDSLSHVGVPIKFVEAGNEFNNLNNSGRTKFINGTEYGKVLNIWIDSIKKHFPSCMIAAIGENKSYPENKNWNSDLLAQCKPDALVWHEYPIPDSFIVAGIFDSARLRDEIQSDWNASGLEVTKLPISVTECNYNYSTKNGVENISEENKQLATFYILKYVSQLPLVKIVCLNNLVGKQGAFDVSKKGIVLQATGRAWEQFRTSAK